MESHTSPVALKAKSYKRLERLMLQNNVRRDAFHKYQIVWTGSEWFAWYYKNQSMAVREIEAEILNNDNSQ